MDIFQINFDILLSKPDAFEFHLKALQHEMSVVLIKVGTAQEGKNNLCGAELQEAILKDKLIPPSLPCLVHLV